MSKLRNSIFPLFLGLAVTSVAANAQDFNVPSGDLRNALEAYMKQAGVTVIYSPKAVAGRRTHGISGSLSPDAALSKILSGTGLTEYRTPEGDIGIVHDASSQMEQIEPLRLAQAAAAPRAVETVTVTSSKLGGADVQSIPIAITALSQEQLTSTQTAGGPDLVKQVPNLTFTKTNFTGYSIQIRGIGTQAISVTTDPAVAVALNDIPFIRNHFFEQEFYDLSQAEVLRGPQGTLYGRNATAGVVNLIPAKPTDQFEAMVSGDFGNYANRRLEGMINVPVIDDRLDIRLAGEWTKRDGYSYNETTSQQIDGRDLWSTRLSIAFKPTQDLKATLVWERYSEDDDRLRSGKQLCKTDPGPSEIGGVPTGLDINHGTDALSALTYLSQGCLPASLYSPEAFEVPNGNSLPYVTAAKLTGAFSTGLNPFASATQSPDLRIIESTIDPKYRSKNDTVELNAEYSVTPSLTFSSQTGFNRDFIYSTEDYNRFDTNPGIFNPNQTVSGNPNWWVDSGLLTSDGLFCDPQLGCSDRLVGQDRSDAESWQLSQEFRITSSFSGPFNFSLGGNYLHYETVENYYVFLNTLTLFTARNNSWDIYSPGGIRYISPYVAGVSDNSGCLIGGFIEPVPSEFHSIASDSQSQCSYLDPNPIGQLNGNGHNYFRSENPYTLNSYAGFGEAYYNLTNELKFTGGLRWTEDRKHFVDIPSELLIGGWGYPSIGAVNQQWDELTGRAAVNWTPKLDFTDQTLVYGSYAHGYKAGGANPPGAVLLSYHTFTGEVANPIHPLTFKPEFIDAFELGSKNTLADGAITLNASAFYYNYENYQISEIVDRTSINLNFDAHIKGAELEASWEPLPGLKFHFAGGYEDARLAKGSHAVDLIDRTAGNPGWVVIKPIVTQASNCILPAYVIAYQLQNHPFSISGDCGLAYNNHVDPVSGMPYAASPTECWNDDPQVPPYPCNLNGYVGFDPGTAPNNGGGFDKDLSGNELPNAPHFTSSFSAEYTIPITPDWAGTLHGDFYYQSDGFARIFNDRPYDQLRGYTNLNLALILTAQNGWQVMGYLKNVFDTTAITGDFLNSDDSGLTTNVFLTDPRLFGVRITKNW